MTRPLQREYPADLGHLLQALVLLMIDRREARAAWVRLRQVEMGANGLTDHDPT